MHAVVCVKQVLDPEMPPRDFAIDPSTRRPVEGRAPLVISTFDEIAVEIALKLREQAGGGTVTALTLGPPSADEVLRRAMAMQADAGVRIDPGAAAVSGDPFWTAAALAGAIRSLQPVDVVLCGRQAGDTDGGQVGFILAEILGLPVVANAILAGPGPSGTLRVERDTGDGTEVVEVRLPALLTATNADVNVPRIPKVKDVMAAHRKPVRVMTLQEVAPGRLLGDDGAWVEVVDLYVPERSRRCRTVEGQSPEEKVEALIRELLAMGVL